MKDKYKRIHMDVAEQYARLSYAKKRQVGCAIVIDGIVIPGYNGTPPGWDNRCEDDDGHTFDYVIHAEQNALDKITRSGLSSVGADVFVTTAPCIICATRLHGAQVAAVYYRDEYKNNDGIDFLRKAGVPVERIEHGYDQSSADAEGDRGRNCS